MKRLSEQRWMELLGDRKAAIAVDLHGLPGYFPVPEGWDTDRLSLDAHLFYYLARHGCEAEVGGMSLRLDDDDLIWISPGVPFRFRQCPGKPAPVLYRFRLAASMEEHGEFCRLREPFRLKRGAMRGRTQVQQIVDALEHPDRYAPFRLRALLLLLSVEMLASPAKEKAPPSGVKGFGERACSLIYPYVNEHIAEHPTAATLARLVGLSPDYFTRVFRQTYGMAPRRWILQQRMNHAALRLRQSRLNVSEDAQQLGYASVFLFSRQFKQTFGCSPQTYRS